MTIKELKQIRLYRQHLTDRADKQTVVKDLCGLQCQFMSYAYHSLRIRCSETLDPETFGAGLVKNWTLRGTVHIFSGDDLPLFKYDVGSYKSDKWDDTRYNGTLWISADRKRYFAKLLCDLVADGTDTREELRSKCRAAGMTDVEESYIFNGWVGLLRPLCERGFLTYRVQEKKAFALSPEYVPMKKEDAKREQMKRYLEHIAPATVRDISYFFGYSQTEVKRILDVLPVENLSIDGVDYFYMGELPGDCPAIPECIFLSGFDQLTLGYEKKDSIFLPPEHLRGIFTLTGIVLPALLLKGKVAGRWRRKGKKIEITPFRKILKKEKKHIEICANRLWEKNTVIEYKN